MKALRRLLVIGNAVLIFALFLGYIRQYIEPDYAGFLTIFSLLYPYIVVALFITMLLLVAMRSRTAWASLLALVLTSGNTIRQIGFHMQPELPDDSTIYTLTTLNVKNNFSHNDVDQSKTFIQKFKNNPSTFLVLQEIAGEKIHSIAQELNYPYHSHYGTANPRGYLAIFSKFPLSNIQSVHNGENRVIALLADVESPMGKIKLVNIHLHTNAVTVRAGQFSPESFSKKEGLRALHSMIQSYSQNARLRLEEIDQLHEALRKSNYPVIIAGDVNDTPYSPVYRKLQDTRQNAFVKGGLGFAQTYNGLLLPLKIDYIFMDKNFNIFHTLVDKIDFSDHNPITTSFTIQN